MKKLFTLILGITLAYSCSTNSDGNSTTTVVPSLTTTAVSTITTNSAISGGTITSDGGASITVRGVCWSTSPNPTIALSSKTTDGIGTGIFTSNISGLIANTTYYLRAYATNSIGTSYGNEISFTTATSSSSPITDIDGNTYQTIQICSQVWTKTNLNVTKYRNGDVIPQVTNPAQWAALTTGAWCYYNNDPANGAIYGKLYNWYAVNDPRGLAPVGYHIPIEAEWNALSNCLGGASIAGGKMKEIGTNRWNSPNTLADNSSGFSAYAGGDINEIGSFANFGNLGYWWTSQTLSTSNAWYRRLNYNNADLTRGNYTKTAGFSIRCVKD